MQSVFIKDTVDQFIYFLEVERGVSRNTTESYRRDILKFLSYLERIKKDINEVDRPTLVNFLMFLKDQGLSVTTVARNLAALKTFWKFLVSERITRENVASLVETPRTWKNIPDVLNRQEVEKLLEAPNLRDRQGVRDKAILELMYATGMRVSEAADLKKMDVNLEAGYVKCFGKGGKERIVPFGRMAKESVEKYSGKSRTKLLGSGRDEHLFLSRSGKRTALAWRQQIQAKVTTDSPS